MIRDLKKMMERLLHSDIVKSERIRKASIVVSRVQTKGPVKKPTSIKALWAPVQM